MWRKILPFVTRVGRMCLTISRHGPGGLAVILLTPSPHHSHPTSHPPHPPPTFSTVWKIIWTSPRKCKAFFMRWEDISFWDSFILFFGNDMPVGKMVFWMFYLRIKINKWKYLLLLLIPHIITAFKDELSRLLAWNPEWTNSYLIFLLRFALFS